MLSHNPLRLVVIDSAVADYQSLLKGVTPDALVIILNRHQDGVEQITTALQHHKTIKTLDIVAHGSPGCLSLGNTQLKHS
ncbi:DUF4347 domain-containing protein, partial [Coleofasciculus sp. F4-SAH-05]|uniref:DUF4347 domain-containing protein n=1 Tax=Coleofasciculus sp. F4-SAH-05 TaxID=3069525 RepID=UPI0032F9AC17